MNIGIGKFLRNGLTRAGVESAFRRLAAEVSAGWQIQHNVDGTHADITADSATISGDVEIGGGINTLTIADDAELSGQRFYEPEFSFGPSVMDGTDDVSDYPTLGSDSSTPDVAELTLDSVNDAFVPSEDDAFNIGHLSSVATFTRRWRNILFSRACYGPLIVATTAFYERSRSTPVGEWIAVAHNAANFTASAGTWTVDSGDQLTYQYTLVGKTMTVNFYIFATDVSNAGVTLRIAIPGSFVATSYVAVPIYARNAGVDGFGIAEVNASGTAIVCYAGAFGTFGSTTGDNTNVGGSITFQVN